MRYGDLEFAYAEPLAAALADLDDFRRWILLKTKFADQAAGARVLLEEMMAKRSLLAGTWWRSHFTEKCRCSGCSGKETDILAIMETTKGERFALHIEVKQPTDIFPAKKDQPVAYRLRSQCWVVNPPKAVVPHAAAATGLFYSARRQADFAEQVAKFDFAITFDEIREAFPNIPIPRE